MSTKTTVALVAALVVASASNAVAARAHGQNYDQRNSTVNTPDINEQIRLDPAKGDIW